MRFPAVSTLSALQKLKPTVWCQVTGLKEGDGSQAAHDWQASAHWRGIIVVGSEQLPGFQCRLGLS